MHRAPGVPTQYDGFPAHAGHEEIARIWNLAFVADEKPGAGEEFLEFFLIEFRRDEDVPADGAATGIDHLVDWQCCCHSRHASLPL